MTDRSILIPGRTCWQIQPAERFALIIDAADFFRTAKEAMAKARRSVLLVGWDFDARIELEPEAQTLDGPNAVGAFLVWLARSRPDIEVRILKWDVELIRSFGRGQSLTFVMGWLRSRRMHFRIDGAHPPLSAQHMKLLVVDETVAFCGGIDMTAGRWDTRGHEPAHPARRSPSGEPQMPWHDATTCVSGPAAKALAHLARDRWFWATGDRLAPVEVDGDPWPESLAPQLRDVPLGIARTMPQWRERPQVCEIEAATLAVLDAAERHIYIESQYFASRLIARRIAERLAEPEGPEVVLVNPASADGWLEAEAMDTARARMMQIAAEADRFGRFRIFYPVNAADEAIYVHAKIMIADDRILKVGSANLNNRSMGYDSECDLILDAAGDPRLRPTIAAARNDLVAEHLGCTAEAVATAMAAGGGSLTAAVDTLNGRQARRLERMPQRTLSEAEQHFAESDAADPIRPVGLKRLIESLRRRVPSRRRPASAS